MGAEVLGAGGGGDPWLTRAMLTQAIADRGPAPLCDAFDLNAEDLIVAVGLVGAPTAMIEQFPGPNEVSRGLQLLEKVVGTACAAVMPIEIGGMNALFPLAAASWLGIPCLDADTMCRSFPRIDMTLPSLEKIDASPAILAGCSGSEVILQTGVNRGLERLARACVREMGLVAVLCAYPMTRDQCLRTVALGSLTRCLDIGRQLSAADPNDSGSFEGFLGSVDGRQLFDGTVVNVVRPEVGTGNVRGTAVIESAESPERLLRVEFQSENIIAIEDGRPLATTPDLIVIFGVETNRPVSTEVISVGQHVRVVGIPIHRGWRSEAGIAVAGPRAYGYDLDYVELRQSNA
ncbi:DUF917 domain-containing protein [Nocardia farcinica]|nr:DUF917 domain-containing protein [Nocardia farcinica]